MYGCLKVEIINVGSVFKHSTEVDVSFLMTYYKKKVEFESGTYVGTGLSVETSKMTGRKIYKYMEPERTESLIDLSSKFEVGVKVSNGNTKRRQSVMNN